MDRHKSADYRGFWEEEEGKKRRFERKSLISLSFTKSRISFEKSKNHFVKKLPQELAVSLLFITDTADLFPFEFHDFPIQNVSFVSFSFEKMNYINRKRPQTMEMSQAVILNRKSIDHYQELIN